MKEKQFYIYNDLKFYGEQHGASIFSDAQVSF